MCLGGRGSIGSDVTPERVEESPISPSPPTRKVQHHQSMYKTLSDKSHNCACAQTPGSNQIIAHPHQSFFPSPGSFGNAGTLGRFIPANLPPCSCATASPNSTLTAPSILRSPLLLITPNTTTKTSTSTARCLTPAHTKRHMARKKR